MLWQRLVHDLPAGYENIWKISHIWEFSLFCNIDCSIVWPVRDAWALDNFCCHTQVDTSPEVSNLFHTMIYPSNSEECSSTIHRPHSHGDLFSEGLSIKGNSCIPWFISLLYWLTSFVDCPFHPERFTVSNTSFSLLFLYLAWHTKAWATKGEGGRKKHVDKAKICVWYNHCRFALPLICWK